MTFPPNLTPQWGPPPPGFIPPAQPMWTPPPRKRGGAGGVVAGIAIAFVLVLVTAIGAITFLGKTVDATSARCERIWNGDDDPAYGHRDYIKVCRAVIECNKDWHAGDHYDDDKDTWVGNCVDAKTPDI